MAQGKFCYYKGLLSYGFQVWFGAHYEVHCYKDHLCPLYVAQLVLAPKDDKAWIESCAQCK